MSDAEVTAAALTDRDAPPLSPEQLARMRRVSRVKVLRQRLGMTQEAFAQTFHLPVTTYAIGSSVAVRPMRRRGRCCSRLSATRRR